MNEEQMGNPSANLPAERQAISPTLRFEILQRDRFTCRYCGRAAPDVPLEIEHVTPVAAGGTDDPANLVAACRSCNRGKRARVIVPPVGSGWGTPAGKFFHVRGERGYANLQGRVIGEMGDGYYFVEFFEWLTGAPNGREIAHVGRMAEERWRFYETDAEMRWAWQYGGLRDPATGRD